MAIKQQVINAIISKNMGAQCNSCGHEDWLVPASASDPEQSLVLSAIVGSDLSEIVGFIPMICRQCGNTRFLHLQTLLNGKTSE